MHFAASKKTIYVLKLLLNFYRFYKMISEDIIVEANELIVGHESGLVELNRCQRQREIYRDRMAEIDKQHEYLGTRIPFVQKAIDDLRHLSANTKRQVDAEQDQLTEAKLDHLRLEQRFQELGDQLVSEEEAAALLK